MNAPRREAGFTLLEILIAIAVLAMISAMVWYSFAQTFRAIDMVRADSDLFRQARQVTSRIPQEMTSAYLPNVLSPVVVEFTVRLGYAIFAVASLTFIGFGVPPPSPDWAAQINQYWTLIDPYWWMTLFPALAIASLVVSVNLVADGIREVYER